MKVFLIKKIVWELKEEYACGRKGWELKVYEKHIDIKYVQTEGLFTFNTSMHFLN